MSRVTVTRLAQNRLTAVRAVSAAVSPGSQDRSVTAVLQDTSTSRKEGAHVRPLTFSLLPFRNFYKTSGLYGVLNIQRLTDVYIHTLKHTQVDYITVYVLEDTPAF